LKEYADDADQGLCPIEEAALATEGKHFSMRVTQDSMLTACNK